MLGGGAGSYTAAIFEVQERTSMISFHGTDVNDEADEPGRDQVLNFAEHVFPIGSLCETNCDHSTVSRGLLVDIMASKGRSYPVPLGRVRIIRY